MRKRSATWQALACRLSGIWALFLAQQKRKKENEKEKGKAEDQEKGKEPRRHSEEEERRGREEDSAAWTGISSKRARQSAVSAVRGLRRQQSSVRSSILNTMHYNSFSLSFIGLFPLEEFYPATLKSNTLKIKK